MRCWQRARSGRQPQPTNGFLSRRPIPACLYIGPRRSRYVQLNAGAVAPVGGSQPHENMLPYLAIKFIISLFGIFPTQN